MCIMSQTRGTDYKRLTLWVWHSWLIPLGCRSFCAAYGTKTSFIKAAEAMRLTAHSDINLVRAPSNLWRSRPCDLNCLCPPRPPHTLLPPHHKIYTHIIIIWHKQDHFLSRSLQLGWKPEWSQPTTVEPFLCFIFDLLASPQRPPTVSGPHIWDHLTTQNAAETANDVIHKLGVWLFMKFRAKVPQLLVREKCQVRESRLIFFLFFSFFLTD